MLGETRTGGSSRAVAVLCSVLIAITACGARNGEPASTTPVAQTDSTTRTSSTSTVVSPSVWTGSFAIGNTSEGGVPVEVTSLRAILESRSGGEDEGAIDADCVFEPSPPFILDTDLQVAFECTSIDVMRGGAPIRATVEATIGGSDEVYRIEATIGE